MKKVYEFRYAVNNRYEVHCFFSNLKKAYHVLSETANQVELKMVSYAQVAATLKKESPNPFISNQFEMTGVFNYNQVSLSIQMHRLL